MYKKTVTYKTFDGRTETEDFYFNFTEAELSEMELSEQGGLGAKLERIVAAEDMTQMLPIFKDVILSAYGQKSDDGKRFIKNEDTRAYLEHHVAFSDIFMQLMVSEEAATDFVNKVVPEDMTFSKYTDNPEV